MACCLLASLLLLVTLSLHNYHDAPPSAVDLPRPLVLLAWAPASTTYADRCTLQAVFSFPVTSTSGLNNTEPLFLSSLDVCREESEEASSEVEGTTIDHLLLPHVDAVVGGQWYSYRSVVGVDGGESCLDLNSSLPLREAVLLVSPVNVTAQPSFGPALFASNCFRIVDVVSAILFCLGISVGLLRFIMCDRTSPLPAHLPSSLPSSLPCESALEFTHEAKKEMEKKQKELEADLLCATQQACLLRAKVMTQYANLQCASGMTQLAILSADEFRGVAQRASAQARKLEEEKVTWVLEKAQLLTRLANAESRALQAEIDKEETRWDHRKIPSFSVDSPLPPTVVDAPFIHTELFSSNEEPVCIVIDDNTPPTPLSFPSSIGHDAPLAYEKEKVEEEEKECEWYSYDPFVIAQILSAVIDEVFCTTLVPYVPPSSSSSLLSSSLSPSLLSSDRRRRQRTKGRETKRKTKRTQNAASRR